MSYFRWKRARYAAPAAVLAAVGVGALVPTLSGASAPPRLSAQTARQMVAHVVSAKAPQLSGTLAWTANLGLSDLSSLESGAGPGGGNGFDPITLLSGNYQLKLWLGANAEHLALIEPSDQEVDFVRNNNQAWLWDSSTQKVLHLIGPAKVAAPANSSGNSNTGKTSNVGSTAGTSASAGTLPLTPMALASQFLDHISPNTSLTIGPAAYVAGQPAYQLLLSPKGAAGSTIRDIEIAVGASGPLVGVPLQVAVYSNGQASPALELGFTGHLNLGPPPASALTFTPPPGSKVTTRTVSGHTVSGHTVSSTAKAGSANEGDWSALAPLTGTNGPSGAAPGLSTSGKGWATVVSGPAGQVLGSAEAGPLSAVTTVVGVHGQQGRLFSTSLLNVLLMPNGRFYAGLVTPKVLEAAASAKP